MSDTGTFALLIGAFVLLGIAVILLSRRRGLPGGRVVYEDLIRDGTRIKPLRSQRYGLSGQPDMLIRNGGDLIPVEVKSASALGRPYSPHVLQMAAYCLLTEETYGVRPPYGIIRYRDGQFEVPFTKNLEKDLLRMMDEMRAADINPGLPQRCGDSLKCRHCGFAEVCGRLPE